MQTFFATLLSPEFVTYSLTSKWSIQWNWGCSKIIWFSVFRLLRALQSLPFIFFQARQLNKFEQKPFWVYCLNSIQWIIYANSAVRIKVRRFSLISSSDPPMTPSIPLGGLCHKHAKLTFVLLIILFPVHLSSHFKVKELLLIRLPD